MGLERYDGLGIFRGKVLVGSTSNGHGVGKGAGQDSKPDDYSKGLFFSFFFWHVGIFFSSPRGNPNGLPIKSKPFFQITSRVLCYSRS